MFNWFKRHKPITVSKQTLQRSLFVAFNGYVASLEEQKYVLVPNRDWVRRNCPVSRVWSKEWDCSKIAIYAMSRMMTHAVGAIKVSWPDNENTHALLVIAYEDDSIELFDPHSRDFYGTDGRKVYKMWM